MAKRFSKKMPHNGKKSVVTGQLVLDLLDNFASTQKVPAAGEPEQPESLAALAAKETWAKIEEAYAKPTTPQEFAAEALRIIGEYRVLLGECEWSCKLPSAEDTAEEIVAVEEPLAQAVAAASAC